MIAKKKQPTEQEIFYMCKSCINVLLLEFALWEELSEEIVLVEEIAKELKEGGKEESTQNNLSSFLNNPQSFLQLIKILLRYYNDLGKEKKILLKRKLEKVLKKYSSNYNVLIFNKDKWHKKIKSIK